MSVLRAGKLLEDQLAENWYILRALVVGLRGVLEEASVLDGDSLAGPGLCASALLVSSLGDAHFADLRDGSG